MSTFSGSSVFRVLKSRLRTAERDAAQAGEALHAATAELGRLKAEETRTLAELARVRLTELDADRVAKRLDDADRAALEHLAARDRATARVREQLARSYETQDDAEDARERRREELEVAERARDDKHAAVLAALREDEEYRSQEVATERTLAMAQLATEKANRAEEDRDVKRRPYEADKLFAYLWKRRYAFPEYRAMPWIRSLDGWVAGLCRYDKAHRDYGMLLEIPERLRDHADRVTSDAQAEASRLEELQHAALAAAGFDELRDAATRASVEFERATGRVEDLEAAHADLVSRLASLDRGTDEHSQAALGVLADQIDSESVATLRADALATDTPKDDELVRALARLRADLGAAEERVAECTRDHDRAQDVVTDLVAMRSRFRRQRFDRSESVFDRGLDFDRILDQVVGGVLDVGRAMRRVGRHQRFERTGDAVLTGIHIATRVLGSMGGRSRGGFGGGGSFGGFGGGGGFSTGGGFGGGGGFSTGGGF